MRLTPLLPLVLTAACATPQPATGTLPLLGPYREPADQCQMVGESALTGEYLDHTADLVACPAGYEGIPIFIMDVNAVQVADLGDWLLFSVPHP